MTGQPIEAHVLAAALRDARLAAADDDGAPEWLVRPISYVAVVDRRTPLVAEGGQPAGWQRLDEPWQGWFSDDRPRMRQCALRLSALRPGP
ncbi:hypothetical protein ABZ825_02775 [Streptomyces tauricus]|uniref:hypothetical protein n=1 Tax=Streptomyces tauricus TaxID=68274 RepID=UPI003406A513